MNKKIIKVTGIVLFGLSLHNNMQAVSFPARIVAGVGGTALSVWAANKITSHMSRSFYSTEQLLSKKKNIAAPSPKEIEATRTIVKFLDPQNNNPVCLQSTKDKKSLPKFHCNETIVIPNKFKNEYHKIFLIAQQVVSQKYGYNPQRIIPPIIPVLVGLLSFGKPVLSVFLLSGAVTYFFNKYSLPREEIKLFKATCDTLCHKYNKEEHANIRLQLLEAFKGDNAKKVMLENYSPPEQEKQD